MIELLVGVILAAGALYYVLRPIVRPEPASGDAGGAVGEGEDPEDDLSPAAVALRALKEIEFDRATGKLSDADYDALKVRYTAIALQALRSEERAPSAVRRELELPAGAPRPAHGVRCPVDGPRPESDALFCSACGRRLGVAPGYCARCGTALEADARYCTRCGARVAA